MKKINLKDMMKRICLCSIVNVSLVLFILIISFYLIRRLNKINLKNKVESFNTGLCKPVIQNKISMNKLAGPLSRIANSLESIDNKIDFINGFKTVKTGEKKKDKTAEVPRALYPDKNDKFRFHKKLK